MIVTLHTQGLQTLAQMRTFVSGCEPISLTLENRNKAYSRMADTLRQFGYTRCIKQFTTGGGNIEDRRRAPAVPFVRRYTEKDIRLLAEWMRCMAHSLAPPRASCASGRSRCMGMPATNGWRAFPTAACTTLRQPGEYVHRRGAIALGTSVAATTTALAISRQSSPTERVKYASVTAIRIWQLSMRNSARCRERKVISSRESL